MKTTRIKPIEFKPGPYPDTYEVAGELFSGDFFRYFNQVEFPADEFLQLGRGKNGELIFRKFYLKALLNGSNNLIPK